MDKKIIYIIGSGRSGTTLLDIVLGNASSFFSAGELNRYAKRLGKPHDPRDEDVSEFWEKVEKHMNPNFSIIKAISDKLEYHSAYLKRFFVSNKNKKLYEEYNSELFNSISSNIEADYIIDSSKYPMRAHHLSKLFIDRISFIYIRRNPSDIVESFQKKSLEQPSKNRLSAHIYLLVVNGLSSVIINRLRKRHKVVTINYSDFVNDTIRTLNKVGGSLEIDFSDVCERFKSSGAYKVGYLFDGNRLRLKNEIIINQEDTARKDNKFDKLMYPVHQFFWYKKM
jgi:hypothetical protein